MSQTLKGILNQMIIDGVGVAEVVQSTPVRLTKEKLKEIFESDNPITQTTIDQINCD
jgi:hypothetical protein